MMDRTGSERKFFRATVNWRWLRMKLVIVILFPVILSGTGVYAQDAKEDLEKINLAYLETDQLSVKMSYKVYRNWKDQNPIQEESGEMKKDGYNAYNRTGNLETIRNKNYHMMIDHGDKTIALMPVLVNEDKNPYMSGLSIDLSKVLDRCEQVTYNELSDKKHAYTLEFPEGLSEYKKVKVIYNAKTYLVNKLVLYYAEAQSLEEDTDSGEKEQPRVEISYFGIDLKPGFAPGTFTYDKYLLLIGEELQCKSQYKKYKFINQVPQRAKG